MVLLIKLGFTVNAILVHYSQGWQVFCQMMEETFFLGKTVLTMILLASKNTSISDCFHNSVMGTSNQIQIKISLVDRLTLTEH